ncbi:hypothetical protein [Ferrimonas marina]|uniref:DUF1439 domain-containing protein n=1 Tax=Ferrimonas marina TaxID=299255 RepID=A0A1M5TCG6_9GAMM|nr:hypothetical protein [Ferrimonas marina]SHH48381.1 hypothetical protein SAMN02745129_2082 [Ferrimonas marina]
MVLIRFDKGPMMRSIIIATAAILLSGCAGFTVSESYMNEQLLEVETRSYEVTYHIGEMDPVDAKILLEGHTVSITNQGPIVHLTGKTIANGDDYTINTTFIASVTGGLYLDTRDMTLQLTNPKVKLHSAREVDPLVRRDYMDLTQEALNAIVLYHFDDVSLYNGPVDDLHALLAEYDFVQLKTRDGAVVIRGQHGN